MNKKKIKVYMAALQSPGSFGVYTLDDVYCFPTKNKRDDWRDTLDANTGVDITYLEDKMEVDL